MAHRDFLPQGEKNGLLHPPSCACVRCAAGRDSQEISPELREKVQEMLDSTFLQMVQGNVIGGYQIMAQNRPMQEVRSGFLGNMEKIMMLREMAAAYFAGEKTNV